MLAFTRPRKYVKEFDFNLTPSHHLLETRGEKENMRLSGSSLSINVFMGSWETLTLHGNVHGVWLAGSDAVVGTADILPRLLSGHPVQP